MKRLKEYFDYEGNVSIEDLMSIMTDEWQDYSRNKLFNESSHYEDEARDEDRYLEISAILEFDMPESTGYSFSNSKVEKEYDKELNKVYDVSRGDIEKYYDVLSEYEPILLVLSVDLKEKIMYATVDLGNGLSSTEVARERLPDDENSLRKTIDKMIDSF